MTVFITCMDCRLNPIKFVEAKPGQVFVMRNPGNMVPRFDPENVSAEAGGLELGCIMNGIRDVVVCGHSDCKVGGEHVFLLRPCALWIVLDVCVCVCVFILLREMLGMILNTLYHVYLRTREILNMILNTMYHVYLRTREILCMVLNTMCHVYVSTGELSGMILNTMCHVYLSTKEILSMISKTT